MPAGVCRLQGDHHQQQSAREPEIVQHLMITNIDQVQKMIRVNMVIRDDDTADGSAPQQYKARTTQRVRSQTG